MNPLLELIEHGQSYWLDNLTRPMIRGGELERRVAEEGLRGVTSNPAIFEKAIASGGDYDDHIEELVDRRRSVAEIYEELTVTDIQDACDVLRPVWESSDGVDGYVSLEVSPYVARDTEGSIVEARKLYERVGRPNVLIKIPGTVEGLPAIEELLFEGVDVNVTLLFSVARYEAVARAYLQALERRRHVGKPLDEVASVASFFLSRIDVLVDRLLGDRIRSESGVPDEGPRAGDLLGRAAIANAKRAYRSFQRIFSGERWESLEAEGARVQRVLWASTSTKDPLYRDVRYVEELIGPHTVNTLPDGTIRAFADHGRVESTVTRDLEEAERDLSHLAAVGVDLDAVTSRLEDEGIRKFVDPYDSLMGTLARRRRGFLGLEGCEERYGWGDADGEIADVLVSLRTRRLPRRLWEKDATLWADDAEEEAGIRNRLGWLHSVEAFRERTDELQSFAAEIAEAGFEDIVLLGMGGSSLSAEVSRDVFGVAEDRPRLRILDDTDPDAVRAVEREVALGGTLFVVASKSGTTAETLSFYRYFRQRLDEAGVDDVGSRFVAVTDPGSPLVEEARKRGFRRVFENPEDIGGRYSVFSWFGLVPMALVGADVEAVLGSASQMEWSCGPLVPPAENPGVLLGAALGTLARRGRNKLTVVATGSARPFGAWLEQLVAESTGKEGKGIVPVIDEPLGDPSAYGDDRVFVGLRVAGEGEEDEEVERRLDALEDLGHPVARFEPARAEALGGEFYRWEMATAVAGAVLGLNPFDQPNVEESKRNTRSLLEDGAARPPRAPDEPASAHSPDGPDSSHSPDGPDSPRSPDEPVARGDGMEIYAAGAASDIGGGAPRDVLSRFLGLAGAGDYVSLQAYLPRTPDRNRTFQAVRARLRDRLGTATTLGYGPRYLHSTGQLHKGGPDQGLHLLITRSADGGPAIPGEEHDFGRLQRAQALGDLRALADRGRRVVRVHLDQDVDQALDNLADALGA